jgi:hypothetical protein
VPAGADAGAEAGLGGGAFCANAAGADIRRSANARSLKIEPIMVHSTNFVHDRGWRAVARIGPEVEN